jgi:hypothetical protein
MLLYLLCDANPPYLRGEDASTIIDFYVLTQYLRRVGWRQSTSPWLNIEVANPPKTAILLANKIDESICFCSGG